MALNRRNAEKSPVLLDSWQGLGDTIYLRPAVRELARTHEVYLASSWPELLEDLDVHFIRPETELRTQLANVERQARAWERPPERAQRLEPKVYWSRPWSISQSVAMSLGMEPAALTFDLPAFPRPEMAPRGPYALVRPVTVRSEWEAPARNPDPRYVAAAAARLQDLGLQVVSVAHLEEEKEWGVEPLPPADVQLHHGEAGIVELMGLVQHAELVVGGVGWLVPAAAALRRPAVIIGGGWGFYNAPERLMGPPMDASRMRFILPDSYCRWCHDPKHDCPKEITGFEEQLRVAIEELGT